MAWELVERPGYLGKKRDEVARLWDARFGAGNWRIGYQWSHEVINRAEALQLYEDAYYEHFKANASVLEALLAAACDVYDTAPTNVFAGYSYDVQETPNNHVHDVAIRRSVLRLGRQFTGNQLIEIRSSSEEGKHLSPGRVPFHLPQHIVPGELINYGYSREWWQSGSIEDFYQKNKVLLAKH